MVSRSYSAKLASIWKMSLPLGLEVSMGSVALFRATPEACSLSWASTVTRRDLPSRSRR
jgi:hypothetical protein